MSSGISARGNHVSKYMLLYGSFFIYSVSAVCAKLVAGQEQLLKMALCVGLEVASLGIYALAWQQVLKKFTLVTAMASKGVVLLFNLAWSAMLFGEGISIHNIVGAAVIIVGVWVVSSDG